MKKQQTHLMYGLITGIACVLLSIIFYVTGLSFKPWAQWVGYIPFLVGMILNAQAYSKANEGFVSFGEVFSSCFKGTAVVTLIVLAWSFIMIYIFPELKEKGMEIARQKMEENNMSEEQIDQAIEMTKKFFVAFMFGGILFGYLFYGAIISLIAAATAKRKPKQATSL